MEEKVFKMEGFQSRANLETKPGSLQDNYQD